jgi:hypothetical protein
VSGGSAATAAPVSVIIKTVKGIDDCRNAGLEAAGESAADFYAKVWIDGTLTQTPRGDEDQEGHELGANRIHLRVLRSASRASSRERRLPCAQASSASSSRIVTS